MLLEAVTKGTRPDISDEAASPPADLPQGEELEKKIEKLTGRLGELQSRFFASGKHALLIVLQGRDASGKDGVVRTVFDACNPQGVRVNSFKVPSAQELAHDYLWRVHRRTPANGELTIFNRSHYEDVLVVRVHDLVPKKVWKRR